MPTASDLLLALQICKASAISAMPTYTRQPEATPRMDTRSEHGNDWSNGWREDRGAVFFLPTPSDSQIHRCFLLLMRQILKFRFFPRHTSSVPRNSTTMENGHSNNISKLPLIR